MITSSPKKFAEWFNQKYPGVHRRVRREDVRDLTVCGLIAGTGTTAEKWMGRPSGPSSSMNNSGRVGPHIKSRRANRQRVSSAGSHCRQTHKTSQGGPENTAPNVNLKEPRTGRRGQGIGGESSDPPPPLER